MTAKKMVVKTCEVNKICRLLVMPILAYNVTNSNMHFLLTICLPVVKKALWPSSLSQLKNPASFKDFATSILPSSMPSSKAASIYPFMSLCAFKQLS